MGRVTEKVKFTNIFEPSRSVEAEALIDTGATMVVLPQDIVDSLRLKKMRETTVRYGNGKKETKSVYGVVTVGIKGREGTLEVLAEPEGTSPLIGQMLLELLDLLVDPATRSVIPNPRSPDMPMVEVL